MAYGDLIELICRGCGDPAHNDTPDSGEGEWRHGDGSPLCVGTEPIELFDELDGFVL
jgi:hypothetical protein